MRVKLFAISLCLAIAGTVGLNLKAGSYTSAKAVSNVPPPAQSTQIPPGSDDSTNPDDIPDRIAYSLLFRFLSNPTRIQNGNGEKRLRKYVAEIGLGKKDCATCPTGLTDEADINALLAAATEFRQRVDVLDQQAAQLKKENRINPDPARTAKLAELQQKKDAVVDKIASSLVKRLSKRAADGMPLFLRDRVKKRIKLGKAANQPAGE